MFTENEYTDARYRGMNPDFVKRVHERRRQEQIAREAEEKRQASAAIAEQKRRERNALREMRAEMRAREVAEREAIESAKKEERMTAIAEARDIAAQIVKNVHVNKDMTARQIITVIAADGNMTYDDLVGPSRVVAVVAVRHRAVIEVYRLKPALSLEQIAREFNRDRTTIMHALDKAGIRRRSHQ